MASENETATPEINKDYLYTLFSDANPGMDEAFMRWDADTQIIDVTATPGFLSARRYILADHQVDGTGPRKPRFMTMYHMRADHPAELRDAYEAAVKAGEIGSSPALNEASVEGYNYHLVKQGFTGSAGMSAMEQDRPDYLEVTYFEPAEGQAAAVNAWQVEHHYPELMQNPEVINAYRGLWAEPQIAPFRHKSTFLGYLAMRTEDLEGFTRSIKASAKTPPPPGTQIYSYTYKALDYYIFGSRIREARAAAKKG